MWPSIEAKGIRREIHPYALTDFLDDVDQDQVISTDAEGMSVRIDTRGLDQERRREILTELARIAEQLKG